MRSHAAGALAMLLTAAAIAPAGARPPAGTPTPRSLAALVPTEVHVLDAARRLDINRMNLWTPNNGAIAFDIGSANAGLVYPRGSGRTIVFASGLWLGCRVGGVPRAAVAEYGQEFGPGSMVGGTFDDPDRPEYITYKVARFSGNPLDTTHVDRTPAELALDPSLDPLLHHSWSEYMIGAAPYGAPTRVHRLNNTATPEPGDSVDVPGPDVAGDMMMWSVYNDADGERHVVRPGQSAPLGVEVRQKTFAFDRGSPLGRTVFVEYTILNKGSNTLQDAYISLWSDPDVGGFTDDLVGCDSTMGVGYAYNFSSDDQVYGATPPAIGYLLLQGPRTGPGSFLGLTAFSSYVTGAPPQNAAETYNIMRGLAPDGSDIVDPTTGQPTSFSYRGDPLAGTGWIDSVLVDKRMQLTTGPVTMAPGDTQTVVAAIVIGQGTGNLGSLDDLLCAASFVRQAFEQGLTGGTPAGLACAAALAPVITSVTPLTGPTGSTLTIEGEGFSLVPSQNVVRVGGIQAIPSDATFGRLTVTVPPGASFGPVTATVAGRTAESVAPFVGQFMSGGGFGPQSFDTPVSVATPAGPWFVEIADLDDAGGSDLVVALEPPNGIQVSRNTSTPGSLSFATPLTLSFPVGAAAMALADLDGDGRVDIATFPLGLSAFSVFRNTSAPGSISFAPRQDFASGSPLRMACQDVDGDGRPDIVTSDGAVYRNTSSPGAISFGPLQPAPTGYGPVAIGDFDGDGRPDLASGGDPESNQIILARNTGRAGVFSFTEAAPLPAQQLIGLQAVDADRDGKPDLVCAGVDTLVTYRNIGFGALAFGERFPYFASGNQSAMALGSVDGDSLPDVMVGYGTPFPHTLSVYENGSAPGTIFLGPRHDLLTERLNDVAAGDLDRDGRADLIGAGGQTNTLFLLRNITAAFTIVASAGPNGSILPSGTVGVAAGASQLFTITPNPGYHVGNVLVDSVSVGSPTSYTFTNVTANHTIAVSFAANLPVDFVVRRDLYVADAPVLATALSPTGDRLYVGGDFTQVGPATGGGVPVAPATGEPLIVFPKVAGRVHAVAPDGAGGWFVGGDFTSVGGVPRSHLAHIQPDGTVSPWNPDAGDVVSAIAVGGSTVYVAGSFATLGGQPRLRIGALDAVTAAVLPWNAAADGVVYALAVNGATIYAAGSFTSIGGAARNGIAALDDTTGSALPWNPSANGLVLALAVDGSTVFAGGSFTAIGGQSRPYIAALDAATGAATSWNPTASAPVHALATAGSVVYAGGVFTAIGGQSRNRIAALDRTTGIATFWNPNANDAVRALAGGSPILYAAGDFTTIGGQPRNRVAGLSAATGLAAPFDVNANAPAYAIAFAPPHLYVGGDFTSVRSLPRSRIAEIMVATGAVTSWNPGASNTVHALAATPEIVYAGGAFTVIGGAVRNRIAALHTSTGSAHPWNPNASNIVRAILVSGDTVFAGGDFGSIGGLPRGGLAALDTLNGIARPWNPGTDGRVYALAVNATTLYAGGTFTSAGGAARSNIAALSRTTGLATAWNPGANNRVHVIALDTSAVYAGGAFTAIGGSTRNFIAALNSTTGAAMPWNPGANNLVETLALVGSNVHAGGAFTALGGAARSYLGAVTGVTGGASALPTSWNPGADFPVRTLTARGDTVYAGGDFTRMGREPQSFVASVVPTAFFTIVASAGPNGAISPSGDVAVPQGQSQLFTIAPSPGFRILDVRVDGVSVGPVSQYTFANVLAHHTIVATFIANSFVIHATAGPGGAITPSGDVTVDAGDDQAFAITADPGHHIANVLVDGASAGAVAAYTFTNVQASHTIAASFASDSLGPPPGTDGAFLLASHGFDDPQGLCRPRGWTPQDLSGLLFAHVDDRFLVNDGYITMGTRALWVGADSTTMPDEVARWVHPEGFGNGWSQRLTSPFFPRAVQPSAVLSFDATIDLEGAPGLLPGLGGNDFLAVQGLQNDGTWTFLYGRSLVLGGPMMIDRAVGGGGTFKYEVHLGEDGNQDLPLAEPFRARIVVQTDVRGSNEDGGVPPGAGAAVIDNLSLSDAAGNIFPPADFEAGDTGAWTLSAANAAYGEALPAIVHDPAATGTVVELRSAFDEAHPSCVWTFTSPGDSASFGAYARIISPWFALAARDSQTLIAFAGRLNTLDQGRVLDVAVRGKRAGDLRPRHVSPASVLLTSGASGGDEASPFVPERVLAYPRDFQAPGSDDSIQIVFTVEDRFEAGSAPGRPPTRLPYFDDIRVYQTVVDSDSDGVANARDNCRFEPATGQDSDGDGCVDSTATLRHVESWSQSAYPVRFVQSQRGHPDILDGSDLAVVRAAFHVWTVDGALPPLDEVPPTQQVDASAVDGVNLVTWRDADFPFPPNVLAVTPTTSFIARGVYDDRVVRPGEIVDADLIFNPGASYATPTHPGAHDLKSVATHEIGHFLGVGHSGVVDATMFFVLQAGLEAATLTDDDAAAVAAAYPTASLFANYATVTGRVIRGEDGLPLPGALVTAVRLDPDGLPLDSVSTDYSREDGRYRLWRLRPGNYSVRITPLDGNVGGFPLTPEYISARLAAIARTDFGAEWWSTPESSHDDPTLRGLITVAAGQIYDGIDIISNVDTLPPAVTAVLPTSGAGDVAINVPIIVRFSEPVDPATLRDAFRFERQGQGPSLAGGGQLVRGREFVFTPAAPLAYGTAYRVRITTALRDLHGVPIAGEFASTFSTPAGVALALTDIQPRTGPARSIVTLLGAGFDPTPGAVHKVLFSVGAGLPDSIEATHVTPTSMVARVPDNAVSGPVVVVVAGPSTSTPVPFTVLPPGGLLAPVPTGTPVGVGFAPTDMALSLDGTLAWVVGDGGLASVDLSAPGRPVTPHSTIAARGIALTPDGRRVVVTRPSRGEVLVADAVRGSGTFGRPIATLTDLGSPAAVTVSADGHRAFVTDALEQLVRELDIDPFSIAPYTQRHQIAMPGTALSGGLALDPQGDRLFVASAGRGLVAIDLATDLTTVVHPTPSDGGVAITPDGAEVLAPGGSPLTSLLTASLPDAVAEIALGGQPRDVAIHPQGRSALVVNGLFDALEVLDLDAASASFHQSVARVSTGRTPVAVAVSAAGGVVAVANHGDRSISVYSTRGADASLRRVIPGVASPGDLAAVETGNAAYVGATLVDLGDGTFPASHLPGQGVGFSVPALPPYQRATTVTLQDPAGTRSLSLPFQIVDPIENPSPKGPPLATFPGPADCGPAGPTVALRVSPDGAVVALARQLTGCPAAVDFYRAGAADDQVLGGFLGRAQISGVVADVAFSPDGTRLFVAVTGSTLQAFDADPASATFTQPLGTVPGPLNAQPTGLATDPLGRFVLVGGTPAGPMVTLRTPAGTFVDTVLTATNPRALAVTGDGHYLVAGMTGRMQLIDLALRQVVATTPLHASSGSALSVAVIANGRRAAGLFANSTLAIWNLDPGAGAIGSELFFGNVFPGAPLSRLLPAPDGDGLLAGCATCTTLVHIEPTVVPPSVQSTGLGRTSAFLARSPDGRRLWVAGADGTADYGTLRLFGLGGATGIDLVTGARQAGRPGETLPLPIRVRLRDDAGRPQVGVVVGFHLLGADPGTLDGMPVPTVRRITDVLGEAEVRWTLGGTAGPAFLRVDAVGVADTLPPIGADVVASDAEIIPQVIQLGPSPGAPAINAGTAVFARFNQRMDPDALLSRMTVETPSGAVPGTITFEDDGRVAILRPSRLLPFGAPCVLRVAAGALDTDGQATVTDAVAPFTIEDPPPVRLLAISPPSGVAGTTVALEGEGFSDLAWQNTVIFGNRIAQVARASTVSLVTSAPVDAATGPVTVTVGGSTSNPVTFNVLAPSAVPSGAIATVPTGTGLSDIAITPDGRRAYVTSPATHTVVVVDIPQLAVVARIAVGLDPQGIALLPDGKRAYVANTGSDDLSEIDTDPASPDYHRVIHTIPVGDGPVDLVASAVGPRVYVANARSGTVSIIDANPDNGTYDQVVTTVNTGSGASAITITPDAARLYVGNASGIVMVDLASQVVTTVNTGSGASAITITPDATLVLALLHDGRLIVLDAVPGSVSFNQVVTTVNTGSGASAITVTPDATLAYVTNADANSVLIYRIERSSEAGSVVTLPGAAVTLTLEATIPIDDGPADIAVDPSHGLFALVANASSGTVAVLGFPGSLPPIAVEFRFAPGMLNLRSMGRWVTGYVEPVPPLRPEEIVVTSVRVNGVVAVDPEASISIGDEDADGRPDLQLKFERTAVQLTLAAGEQAPVSVGGTIGTRAFAGTDTIQVRTSRVTRPQKHETVDPLRPYTVRWEVSRDVQASVVALLHSLDHGKTWTLDATQVPNKGFAEWTPPLVVADSVRVAVVQIESAHDSLVSGVMGVSEYFQLSTATGVELPPLRLTLSPITPNPSVGVVRMRFGLPRAEPVDLALYDVQGRRLATLAAGERAIGWHDVVWTGRTDGGGTAGAGIYFVRFRAQGQEFRQRLIWMR